jgi:hypothetical protein
MPELTIAQESTVFKRGAAVVAFRSHVLSPALEARRRFAAQSVEPALARFNWAGFTTRLDNLLRWKFLGLADC